MPVHQPFRSERMESVDTLDHMHQEQQQAARLPVSPAEVDNNNDYLRHQPSESNPKPL